MGGDNPKKSFSGINEIRCEQYTDPDHFEIKVYQDNFMPYRKVLYVSEERFSKIIQELCKEE